MRLAFQHQRWLPGVRLGLLLATLAILGGCQVVGFFVMAFPPDVKAKYKLKDRTTLVLVEDPEKLLGDPNLVSAMASQISFKLKDSGTVKEVVSAQKLNDLMEREGENFDKMPLDEMARRLGAMQVIDVTIVQSTLNSAPSLYKPVMAVRVKLIDVEKGRLYPKPEDYQYSATDEQVHGFLITDKMSYHVTTDSGRSEAFTVMKLLAERIGRAAAELFYDHTPPMPSSDVGNDD